MAGGKGGHSLKGLAKVYLRADADHAEQELERLAKSIGTKLKGVDGAYFDLYRAYPGPLVHYAKLDARYTWDLFSKFSRQLSDRLGDCYALERGVLPILTRAEERGVRIDQAKVLELKAKYEARARELADELAQELGEDALGGNGSEAALLEALQIAGVPLHRKTRTGQLSTDKFALQEFEDKFPVIAKLQEYRQMNKFLATYIGPMVGKESIHPSFRQMGAWTSRMSCSSPNLQNIPVRSGSEVRSVFVPREGYSFVVCDYDSIEVRLLAYYMGNHEFRQLIEDGHDVHAWVTAQVHGGRMEDYVKGSDGEKLRAVVKNTVFAVVYGAGAPRISDMNKISREEAKALIAKVKKSLPGYFRLNKRIRDKIESVGYVETLFGQKQIVRPEKAYVGLSALIQGSAAGVFKAGVIETQRRIDASGIDAHQLLFIHDEIVAEAPTEHADEGLALMIAAMESAADICPSLKVSGKVVHGSYAEAK
jgi:DNA polymerase-1